MAKKRGRETRQEEVAEVRWTKEERSAKKKLEKLKFEPTKFASREFLLDTRMLGAFDELLGDMGLSCLATMDTPTYPEPTLHFLSTMVFSYEDPSFQTPSTGFMTFKVRGSAYKLSIMEICQAYNLNAEATQVEFPRFKSASDLWDTIADGNYKGNTAKIKKVRSPLLRYTLKLLANTFSGRSTTPTVTKNELCFLFQGLKKILCVNDGEDENGKNDEEPMVDDLGDDVNYGCILATSLVKYKAWALRAKAKSSFIGGFLTPLFEQAGVNLTDFEANPNRSYMDQAYMMITGSLAPTPAPGFFAYRFYNAKMEKKICILPNLDETLLDCIGNIEFLPTDEECFSPLGKPPATTAITSPTDSPTSDAEMPSNYELPMIDFEPRTKTEKFLASMVKMQKKINKWQGKMIKKLMKKVKELQRDSTSEEDSSDDQQHLPRTTQKGIVIREQTEDQPMRQAPQQPPASGKGKETTSAESPRKTRRTGASSSSDHN